MLWQIGAVRFAVQRQELEWLIARAERPEGENNEWYQSRSSEAPAGFEDQWARYVCGDSGKPLYIMPALADRPVVSRPISPFTLFPGEQVHIYVSTPLWARVVTEEKGTLLKEFPLLPLSDTWFGPNTREGELCYAARTHARVLLEDVPCFAHRATCSILLKNRADTALVLERLNLPVNYLGLYQNSEGELWTEEIEMVREGETGTAKLKIKPGPPAGLKGIKTIATSREKTQSGLLVRAFSSLFG